MFSCYYLLEQLFQHSKIKKMEILNQGNINDFYHIDEDLLGEGMNKVVRGLNIKSGEEVAVKIINTKDMGDLDLGYLFKEI